MPLSYFVNSMAATCNKFGCPAAAIRSHDLYFPMLGPTLHFSFPREAYSKFEIYLHLRPQYRQVCNKVGKAVSWAYHSCFSLRAVSQLKIELQLSSVISVNSGCQLKINSFGKN